MERFEDDGLENWNEEALSQGIPLPALPPPEPEETRHGFCPSLQREHDLPTS